MARPAFQLAAGLLLLVGLLGLSTALIAEVRDKVLRASEEATGDPAREVRRSPSGLPVPELTLLDPAVADVPSHTPTRKGVAFTSSGQLRLGPGDGIQPGAIDLDGEAVLELGPGWDVSERGLECTEPCHLETGGQRLALPAGSALVAPDETHRFEVDRVLEPGARIDVPAGTQLELPEIRFPSGTNLPLEAGAHAKLPEPREQWSPLLEADPPQLPAGTVLTRSSAATGGNDELAAMLDQARARRPDPVAAPLPEQPTIEVTDTPDTIRKGQTFNVTGTVEDRNGTPLTDHPVSVYANASKAKPGIEIHTHDVETNASGVFEAQARLPESEPTRPYHILAKAHARLDHEPPLEAAWSDPVVGVEGEADLQLDVPQRAGVHVPLTLAAVLQDAHGAPIPGQTVRFDVEGTPASLRARTDADGQALAVLEEGLSFTGNYTIQATFAGTENVTGDEARASIEAVRARIDANATHRAPRGQPTEIQGRVVTDEGPPGRVQVLAHYADNVTVATDTDEEGRFTLELPLSEDLDPGNHTVQLEAPAVDAHHRLILTATARVKIEPSDPGPQPVSGRAPLRVTIRSDNGTPLEGVPVEAHTEQRVRTQATSDANGHLRLGVLLPRTGTQTVTLEADPPAGYVAQPHSIDLRAAPLEVKTDLGLPPGGTANGTLELSVADTPLTGLPLRLVGPGFVAQATTDQDGRAEVRFEVSEDLEPGRVRANLTLPSHAFHETVPLRVLEEPQIDVQFLSQGRDGEDLRIAVTVTGDDGPLDGVPLAARAQGAFEARDRALTDANGSALLTLHRPEDAEGLATIDLLAQATQTTAPTAHTTSTQITPSPTPWEWLAVGALSLGLAATVALRRRSRDSEDPAPVPAGPTPALSMRLDDQPDGGPPVWHPGERPTLEIRLEDETGTPIAEAEVRLEGPPGTRTLTLDARGRVQTQLPAHERGTYAYRARYEDDEQTVETLLELRIVDYREEIDREYRQLRQQARRLGLVDPGATPRELADALGPPADELARLFERYDYSPHPVDRDDYERFLEIRREADPRE